VVLVGIGVSVSLANYNGFAIVASYRCALDVDPQKIGMTMARSPCAMLFQPHEEIRTRGLKVAMLGGGPRFLAGREGPGRADPTIEAHKGHLNYATITLTRPKDGGGLQYIDPVIQTTRNDLHWKVPTGAS